MGSIFRALVVFELRRRLKVLSTYIYAAILGSGGLFLMLISAGTFKSISSATGSERVWANGPTAVMGNMSVMALMGLFTVSALFGQAGTQDFLTGTWSIIFTRKIRRSTYVLGRFVGALVFAALLFLAIPAGMLLGAGIAQVVDPAQLGPHRLDVYLWAYLVSVLPMLLLAGSVFFTLAALTRQMAPVYVGVVVLVLGYLVLSSALGDVAYRDVSAVLDPFGFLSVESVTRYWTAVERNRDLVPLGGLFLVNRLLWTAVAVGFVALTVARFRTSVDEQRSTRKTTDEAPDKGPLPATPPAPTTVGWVRTTLSTAWLLFTEILRSPVYWSLLVAGLSFMIIGIVSAPQLFGTATLPMTYQVLELASGTFGLFSLIAITFYAGELVWRERDSGAADIVYATRAPDWVLYLSRVGALVLVAASLQLVVAAAALSTQLAQGFTDIDGGMYVTELLFFNLGRSITLAVLAITVQVVVNHKYLGHGVMVGYFVSQIALGALGVEDRLVRYGAEPRMPYSDMNGYGHWVGSTLWYRSYWYAVSAMLLVLGLVLFVRSRETRFRTRVAGASRRLGPALRVVSLAAIAVAVGLGGTLWYRTHVEQPFLTDKDAEKDAARYEKEYRSWLARPQPRIASAEVQLDVYPEEDVPRLVARGTYRLENRTDAGIAEVLLSIPSDARRSGPPVGAEVPLPAAAGTPGAALLAVGGRTTPTRVDEALGLYVFPVEPPLEPGASVDLSFDLTFLATPLRHGSRRTDVVENGTFFNNFNLPLVGYNESAELSRDGDRKSHGLPPKDTMRARDDPQGLASNYIRQDSDFITVKATVSTVPDQVAIFPGALTREWIQDGRRYFRYEMDQPILNFFSVLSARYEVKRDTWNGVKLEIYHHPSHTYNLDRMMAGMKDALEYCSSAFGPYQHTQARIIEFPRYQQFAQSFPNTIPYSEAIGFVARVREDSKTDLDYPYYVTAHEIAHQWWAHQVVAANVRGATMTSETMAQYSALMVMKHRYGELKMRRFLKYELDGYLLGRALEQKKEQPLALNENQQYIHYRKGSLAMYALQHFIGEDRVNAALKAYVEAVRFKGPPYTTSAELVDHLRAHTPEQYRYLIEDLFETITLYDNRATSATVRPNPAGGWDVSVKVKAVKYRADETGAQKELTFTDFIDVGALDEDGEALFVEPRQISSGESTVSFTVDRKPARVGIDPLNMLVDRTADDNTVAPDEG